jgi:hypothetical protein
VLGPVPKAEGKAERRLEGQRTILLRLLGARFGRLSQATIERVERSTSADLDAWAERVLTADRLDAVFA